MAKDLSAGKAGKTGRKGALSTNLPPNYLVNQVFQPGGPGPVRGESAHIPGPMPMIHKPRIIEGWAAQKHRVTPTAPQMLELGTTALASFPQRFLR